MKKTLRIISVFSLAMLLSLPATFAEEWKGTIRKDNDNDIPAPKAAFCLPATGSSDLDINNVRTRINTGGDMWWDFEVAQYEVPKGSRKHSMFSASLWIGGLDVNGQLKLAALRYRQVGNDYWTGPLTIDGNASIDQATCKKYDRHWKITRAQVEKFIAWNNNPDIDPDYVVPKVIQDWPAHPIDGNPLQSRYLAPFMDVNGDGEYRWEDGDYPYYDFTNELCPRTPENLGRPAVPTKETEMGITQGGILSDQVLKGDETLWWVFNDKGAPHTETKGDPIGLEIRAQAFAFATNDEINNMTFYSYEIINRSTYTLTQTYFSQWVDTDLGDGWDDYVGCDVGRGLGYCYNGKEIDGTGRYDHYGAQPPAIGVDFFQGPYMDPDGIDNPKYDANGEQLCDESINGVNFGDGIIDNERFGMRRFVYHNNTGGHSAMTDPTYAHEYYNFLRGIWKDGQKMTYGGNAHPDVNGNTTLVCDFMFPDDSDIWNWGTGCGPDPANKVWNEVTAGNAPYDRRFMQSAGPFTLYPGAVNYITVGIPWARASSGGAWASVELLKIVDDICQTLFDNCFKVLDGPDSPDLIVQELDRELILYIDNPITSNNVGESYMELDANIPESITTTVTEYIPVLDTTYDPPIPMLDSEGFPMYKEVVKTVTEEYDRFYRFEGYQIFQLRDKNVSIAEINDVAVSRLVFQCDIENYDSQGNPIGTLINYHYNEETGSSYPEIMVTGANKGIKHSVKITEDRFAEGDKRLINNKKYYYVAVAYAYNSYKQYIQDDPLNHDGQKKPYLAGRKDALGNSITPIIAIPHITTVESDGTVLNSKYGDRPTITRIEGHGNGGLILDLTKESVDKIMSGAPWRIEQPEYIANAGPIDVKVIDPLNVKGGKFTLKFTNLESKDEVDGTFGWVLEGEDVFITSEETINVGNEQIIFDLGLSINIEQFVYKHLFPDAVAEDSTSNARRVLRAELLTSSVTFADSTKQWITGVPDIDGAGPYNWIRSGTVSYGDEPTAAEKQLEDYYIATGRDKYWLDPDEQFEKIIDRTWAPFVLTAKWQNGLGYADEVGANRTLTNLYSVDVVLTPDKSKWSRAMVLEAGDDPLNAEGGALKLDPRKAPSVDKDGNPDGSGTEGMGWFPGYAINVETGERLNIMFAEDSWLKAHNGNDMLFNPTTTYNTYLGDVIWGGKHFVYIMGASNSTHGSYNHDKDCPPYDECQWIYDRFQEYHNITNNALKRKKKTEILYNAMWTSIPMAVPGEDWLSNEVKFRIRVSRPYHRYYSRVNVGAENPQNDNFPMYSFNTTEFATVKNNIEVAESALDLINVVPNPYYGFSFYEETQIDTRVKITNLPDRCVVSIYSMSGSLIRQYTKDDNVLTSLDWDLKNHAGIPISGGVYLIHVKADGIGERTIKWFGALRPTDLNSF
ncbi:MAG: T9SS C-terminal target domain-containing protein [Bacteroidales bacterium]|jgi:hypothetical protein|nr:T9SS C-terminal target domain-containing protein [Bacteroidales bacterium]